MKAKYFKSALQYAAWRKKKNLYLVINKDEDARMAAYILEHRKDTLDAGILGISLVWAVHLAGKDSKKWLNVTQLIHQHPEVEKIDPYSISGVLYDCALNKNVSLMRELLSFPQVPWIKDWDQVLFASLPKGDPEKRRIEQRAFEDTDGDPEILKMVRETMARTAKPSKKPAHKNSP